MSKNLRSKILELNKLVDDTKNKYKKLERKYQLLLLVNKYNSTNLEEFDLDLLTMEVNLLSELGLIEKMFIFCNTFLNTINNDDFNKLLENRLKEVFNKSEELYFVSSKYLAENKVIFTKVAEGANICGQASVDNNSVKNVEVYINLDNGKGLYFEAKKKKKSKDKKPYNSGKKRNNPNVLSKSRVPYGFMSYNVLDDKYELDNNEVDIIKLIFKLKTENNNTGVIVKYLNDNNKLTRNNKSWRHSQIIQILKRVDLYKKYNII